MKEELPLNPGSISPNAQVKEAEPGLNIEIHGNNFIVNGEMLTPQDPPEVLQYALTYNKGIIEEGIDRYLEVVKNLSHNKDAIVQRAPVQIMKLGSIKKTLTALGLDTSTGVHSNRLELKEKYHPLWQAIENSGFVPEARQFESRTINGVFLYFRLPKNEPKE
jgi:hypothetical protein